MCLDAPGHACADLFWEGREASSASLLDPASSPAFLPDILIPTGIIIRKAHAICAGVRTGLGGKVRPEGKQKGRKKEGREKEGRDEVLPVSDCFGQLGAGGVALKVPQLQVSQEGYQAAQVSALIFLCFQS